MAFLTFQARCKDCDRTLSELKALREQVESYRREVKDSLLDYESLYDKVRVNLAKLARRENAEEVATPAANGPEHRMTAGLVRKARLGRV